MSSSQQPPKKHGQPSKYHSAEKKKRKYADQHQQGRQLAATAKQDAQFTNHHSSSANSLPPAVGLHPEQELVIIFNKLDKLLPPDNPVLPSDYIASKATRIPDLALVEDMDSTSNSPGLLPDNSKQINTGAGALSSSDPPDKSKITSTNQSVPKQVTSHLVNTLNIEVSVPNPTHELGKHLTDQLIQHHGEPFPDVLGQNRLPKRVDNLAGQTTVVRKMEVYNRILSDSGSTKLIHVCLQAKSEQQPPSSVMFDIDSIISLYLSPIPVSYFDHHGHAHTVRRPVHQVPHYTFGRVVGFEDISLYLLFPRLYREEQHSLTQHYPSSYNHSQSNATARGVEIHSQKVDSTAREQALFYFLQPDLLHEIWGSILETIQKPGLHQFQGIRILLQAKNLKTLTKDHSWQAMTDQFEEYWHHVIVEDYTTAEFYFDITKEVCPSGTSWVAVQHDHAEALPEQPQGSQPRTLLWKQCCLDSYAAWIQNPHGSIKDGFQQTFYPITMLQDSGSLTLETHAFYSSAKKIFAAGNIYSFTNTAIKSLALDPKLQKTWQLVGKGLSHDPCYHALQGSSQKSFGTCEEHQCLNWLCWNINKFCAGFEMVYSLNNYHFVTWEHTHFSYSTGLIQQTTMKQFGYAWFLNKLFTQHIMFNSSSMQAVYCAYYLQVYDAYQWIAEFSSIPPCLDLLEDFLRQLCLCVFWKDVFAQIKQLLHPDHIAQALAGEVPLCWPRLVGGNRLKVKTFEALYAWLWEWKDGHYDRKGWQSFEIITQIRGKNQARHHWLLPYPHRAGFMQKSKETGQEIWWSNYHNGLDKIAVYPAMYARHYPTQGWAWSQPQYINHSIKPEIELVSLSEADLYHRLCTAATKFNQEPLLPESQQPTTYKQIQEIEQQMRQYQQLHAKFCP
ncbi:hypothetical protein BDW59DRAFT_155254 [Aspergillus cavernicola]|uniref:Uncharacterized protein n=1 Tax=Aspergillus cavernicola TaxID=176166 RepID=A0ABR4HCD3_9EURO